MKTIFSIFLGLCFSTVSFAQENTETAPAEQPGSVIDADLTLENQANAIEVMESLPIPVTSIPNQCDCQVTSYHAMPAYAVPLPQSGQVFGGSTFTTLPMQNYGVYQAVPMPQPTMIDAGTNRIQPVYATQQKDYYTPQRPFRRGFRFNRFRR